MSCCFGFKPNNITEMDNIACGRCSVSQINEFGRCIFSQSGRGPWGCGREVACSASDCQGSNFESQSSRHPQEVLLAQFSLYVHKGDLKPDSFHLFSQTTGICFRHLKLEIVSSIAASNDEKYNRNNSAGQGLILVLFLKH